MASETELLKHEILKLKLAVDELAILNEIALTISSIVDLNHVVDLIIQKCVKHLHVDQGAVMLLDEKDKVTPFHTVVRKGDSKTNQLPFRLDAQLTGWMIKNQKPLLSNDFQHDERFQISKNIDTPFNSLLAVPLQLKGKMLGSLVVFNKYSEEGFTDADKRLLTIIAAQSAQVIEHARLYQEEQELFKIQHEMNVAGEIQLNLLPKDNPAIPDYDIYGISKPAKEVGGDYYDFILLENNKLAFCLGDVSGKGISAAMLMANLQATFRSHIYSTESIKTCIERSNKLLYQNTSSEKYATFFCGILNFHTHQINFSNAGHNNPILITKSGKVQRLQSIGIVLGFIDDFDFSESKLKIDIGETLVIFSDGISEALNYKEEEFEEGRLKNVIIENKTKTAQEITNQIIESVNNFTGDMPQSDDMTLVVIKRN
jgi:sigma-B regulation protein RsbU (phosphoserine phosphatase)